MKKLISLGCLGFCVALTTLTGCASRTPTPFSPMVPSQQAKPAVYRVLFNFQGGNGQFPLGSLIEVNGVLYGTTSGGGSHGLAPKDGVAFSMSTSGEEHVLHDFGATKADGNYPGAALLDLDGTLYGTTELGNTENTGTVFSISTTGKEQLLYSFGEFGPSGMQPSASLTNLGGTLYGTTNFGGESSIGTVFGVSASGKERVLHSFGHPYKTDGQIPAAPLIALRGTLYGTTYEGGTYYRGNCGIAPCPGDGTVFSITPAGKVSVLHSFGGSGDGVNPQAGLLDVNGTLYGTTLLGGTDQHGIIFSITPSGTEHIVHRFGGSPNDGDESAASLIDVGGTLYGTTQYGGANGKGTVFSISPSGSGERILHSFGASGDGRGPAAALLYFNHTLYGTTNAGGAYDKGTVFALTP